MNLRAVGAECRYILRTWSRSGSHVVLSLVMPLMLLLALGFVFGADAEPVPLVHVEDLAQTNASRAFVLRLEENALVQVREGPAPSEPEAWLRSEGLAALVRLPSTFGTEDGNASAPEVLLAEADSFTGRAVRAEIERALLEAPAEDGPQAVDVRASPPGPTYRGFLLAGIVGLSTVTTGLSVGFASISELRHEGLLPRLAASPLRKHEWLLGRMLGVGMVSLASVVVLLLVARIAFGATFVLGPWTFPLVIGGTLVFAGLGTLLGLAVERPEAGAAVLNLVLVPMILLSGTFFELARIPSPLRWIAQVSPLTHLVKGLRADMLGAAPADAFVPALVLLGSAAILLLASGRIIRWTERG